MKAGDEVRYRGAVCVVVELLTVIAPSGAEVRTALIDRPRSPRRWVLVSELEPVEPPADEEDDALPW